MRVTVCLECYVILMLVLYRTPTRHFSSKYFGFKFEQFFCYVWEARPTERIASPFFSSKNNMQKSNHTHHHYSCIMTGPLQQTEVNVPSGDSSQYKYFKAVNNKYGVRQDMESLCKFVRETLFYAMIHDARGSGSSPNDEIMGENGKASQIFIHIFMRDKEKISNMELVESTREEKEQYLKFLWKEGLRTKGKYNIRKALSNEKSAVYAGISESFKSKWCREVSGIYWY